MLDQNTDRMWYVIGALVVGAGIILLANKAMPEMFASVTESFEGASSGAMSVIDEVGYTRVLPEHIAGFYVDSISYDASTDTFTLQFDEHSEHPTVDSGLRIKEGFIVVPYNHQHTISYEVFVPTDTTSVQDVNTLAEGGISSAWRSRQDNDEWERRLFNGSPAIPNVDYNADRLAPVKSQPLTGGQWTSMSYSYTNTDPLNAEQKNIIDVSTFGARLPEGHTGPYTIKIRHVRNIITELGE